MTLRVIICYCTRLKCDNFEVFSFFTFVFVNDLDTINGNDNIGGVETAKIDQEVASESQSAKGISENPFFEDDSNSEHKMDFEEGFEREGAAKEMSKESVSTRYFVRSNDNVSAWIITIFERSRRTRFSRSSILL